MRTKSGASEVETKRGGDLGFLLKQAFLPELRTFPSLLFSTLPLRSFFKDRLHHHHHHISVQPQRFFSILQSVFTLFCFFQLHIFVLVRSCLFSDLLSPGCKILQRARLSTPPSQHCISTFRHQQHRKYLPPPS